MSAASVCLLANTVHYPAGGGMAWAYLNWALGLRALGCRVTWMEVVDTARPLPELQAHVAQLRCRLREYGFADALALCSPEGALDRSLALGAPLDFDAAADADALFNIAYHRIGPAAVRRFRRSVLVDIDPGLTQMWMTQGYLPVAPHDLYLTIGETVGRPGARFPDCGMRWHYTPPPVFLPAWPTSASEPSASYTTVTHWDSEGLWFEGRNHPNGKRDGFLPFADLPRQTTATLELAVVMDKYEDERASLEERGWRIRHPHAAVSTPWDYQRYVRQSRGEFSCAKPSCVLLQNAWVSDRTLCYLASGKPAVVQHTGPSRILPDAEGLFRFRTVEEAAAALENVEADYDRACRAARALAEEHFDAKKVIRGVLEQALA